MEENKFAHIKCKQQGCTASIDGICLEGLELKNCPHCTIEQDDEIKLTNETLENKEELEKNEKIIDTHSGEALNLEKGNFITSGSLTRLIVLAGNVYTGKTTLLGSLFLLFQQKRSFSNYIFVGSLSLIGFERRYYDSLIVSGREEADTERTKFSTPEFLHLKVRRENEEEKDAYRNLLLTDISGELFKILGDSTEECKKFELIKRADHFVLFFDSDKLSVKNQRHEAKINSINILRSLIDSGMLETRVFIEIVFSKWDLLLSKEDIREHKKFIEGIKEEIITRFSLTHKNIRFYEIASRPTGQSKLGFGHGIDQIFSEWAEKTPFINNSVLDFTKFSFNCSREFSKYKYL